jgi:hypothetical protein
LFIALVLLCRYTNTTAAYLGLDKIECPSSLMLGLRERRSLHRIVRDALIEGVIGKMSGVILSQWSSLGLH